MSKEYWKEVLDTARDTLAKLRLRRDELDAEREEVNLEIVQLEQVVTNLTPLVSEPPQDSLLNRLAAKAMPASLAEACREVLKSYNQFATPIEIRNALEASDYDLSQHTNALASIHGVLKRMVESGEVEPLTTDLRGTMYRWKSQGTRMPNMSPGGSALPRRRYALPEFRSSIPTREEVRKEREEAAIRAEERDIETLRRRTAVKPTIEKDKK